jgi:hypothetical protein
MCDDSDPHHFNRGRAINHGMAQVEDSRSILLFADADLLLPAWAVLKSIETVRDGLKSFAVPFNRLVFLSSSISDVIRRGVTKEGFFPEPNFRSYPFRDYNNTELDMRWSTPTVGTFNVVSRETFDFVGRFEPRLHGWGFEDSVFNICVMTLTDSEPVWTDCEGVHLWHPSARNPNDAEFIKGITFTRERYEPAYGNKEAILQLIAERSPSDYL